MPVVDKTSSFVNTCGLYSTSLAWMVACLMVEAWAFSILADVLKERAVMLDLLMMFLIIAQLCVLCEKRG